MKMQKPWYQTTLRWGQTNLTETDPKTCDIDWWREYWHQTRIHGIIVNAGGIVAYYPSSFELQYRAQWLGDRDLLGEFTAAAREDGLAVLARMDINRVNDEFYTAHPSWVAVNVKGEPYQADGRYFTCINSDYYKVHIPEILKEIIFKYHPDGFADNSWTGISRNSICYCEKCRQGFKDHSHEELPIAADWDDPVYRKWIKWSYICRTENWDLFNRITKEFGGSDCLWLGMINANPVSTHCSFCDLKDIGERSEIVLTDHQSRDAQNGFEQNSLGGSLLHSLVGWDKVIPESIANYVRGMRTFRLCSNPPKETQKWMIEGMAGGISPWFHHVGAVQEDLRQFKTIVPLFQWHQENELYLYNRQPVASVGLVWSQDNIEFYGRDDAEERVALPWRGFVKALVRARIPFIPLHADHIDREAEKLDLLVFPDLAVMTDLQCMAVQRFVERGGSVVFTGSTGILDEWGNKRVEFPFESMTGIRHTGKMEGYIGRQTKEWVFSNDYHSYVRIEDKKHPIVKSIENTDIIPFGGQLHQVECNSVNKVIATYIPTFPLYPPEFSWMREPKTGIPVILASELKSGGRLVYFAGDIDRCYGRSQLPDHGDVIAHSVRWALKDQLPIEVEGPGYIDCRLYTQKNRLILHLVNLSGCNQNPGYIEDFYPVGPIKVSIKMNAKVPVQINCKVSKTSLIPIVQDTTVAFTIDTLINHELIVIEYDS